MKDNLYAIVIGASEDSIYAINEAQKMGFSVVAFDGNPMADGLKHADISCVLDIKKHELIIQKLNELNIVPDVILPIPIGRCLLTTGLLNDFYHLIGVNYNGADYCTDKFKFHNLLFKNHLRNINCQLISHLDAEVNFNYTNINYPAIIKPRYGSGSRSVYVVNNQEELNDKFISCIPFDEDFIIEDVKNGIEYGIDAAMINGIFILILLRKKILTPYPYRQCTGYYTEVENKDTHILFEEINKFMLEILNIMGLDNILLHADIIYNENEIFIVEISGRPSGHNLHNLFTPIATGINMISEFIKYAVPKLHQEYSFCPKWKKYMLIKFFDFENCTVVSSPDKSTLINKYPLMQFEYNHDNQVMGKVIDGNSIMKRGYFILEGKDKRELEEHSRNILSEFVLEKL